MKSIPTIMSFFFLVLVLHLVAAAPQAASPTSQRNRPANAPIKARSNRRSNDTADQRNRPASALVKPRSNRRNNDTADQRNRPTSALVKARRNNDTVDHSLQDRISCNVDSESPLSGDVSSAISALKGGDGHPLRCNFDNTPGDGGNQLCTTLVTRGSTAISICTTSTEKMDCGGIAEIVMAVSAKCEEECAGELRVAGMVNMAWGEIFVNSAIEPRAE